MILLSAERTRFCFGDYSKPRWQRQGGFLVQTQGLNDNMKEDEVQTKRKEIHQP